MQKNDGFSRLVDRINERVGNVVSVGILLLTAIALLEVILRYVFNRPTIWAWETNGQIFAAVSLLGGGYTLLHNGHVRLDVVYAKFNSRNKALADILTFPLFLLFTGIVLWQGIEMAYRSLRILEHSPSLFSPPVYPIKICLPIGAFLLLLQGVVKFIRDLTTFLDTKKG